MLGLNKIQSWYTKHERRVSSFSLLGGFVFDAFTLNRVDALRDNLWVAINLIVVSICIVSLNRMEHSKGGKSPTKHFWLVTALQFSFGTLIGTFVIFYFRSAALAVSWPFILILVLALISNEYLKKHYNRVAFQVSFLFFSIYLFSIFVVPLLVHQIGPWVFLLSGIVSLLILRIFFIFFNKFNQRQFELHQKSLRLSVASIFVLINVLYFSNIIHPLPLSLKDSGIYHSIKHDVRGNYLFESENRRWFERFKLYPDVHLSPTDVIYAYSAVFSPASFNTGVEHEWEHFDESRGEWVTQGRVNLSVSGGRDAGYRTYSTRVGLEKGHWRVNVLTSNGLALGRLRFNVVPL
jgi:hypothetical protein